MELTRKVLWFIIIVIHIVCIYLFGHDVIWDFHDVKIKVMASCIVHTYSDKAVAFLNTLTHERPTSWFVTQRPNSKLGRYIFHISRPQTIRHTHTHTRTHTHTHTHTACRTPLNEWSARRRATLRTQYTNNTGYLMFCWPCNIVYQYSETNVMHFLFNLLRMFRALLAHPQEVVYKRYLVYCVRVMSVGCARINEAKWHNKHATYHQVLFVKRLLKISK
jgi:hypothetical protein